MTADLLLDFVFPSVKWAHSQQCWSDRDTGMSGTWQSLRTFWFYKSFTGDSPSLLWTADATDPALGLFHAGEPW